MLTLGQIELTVGLLFLIWYLWVSKVLFLWLPILEQILEVTEKVEKLTPKFFGLLFLSKKIL